MDATFENSKPKRKRERRLQVQLNEYATKKTDEYAKDRGVGINTAGNIIITRFWRLVDAGIIKE